MHISLDGFVAGPNGEMNRIKVDEEIFDHAGKRISGGDTALYGRVTYQMMGNYYPTAGDKKSRGNKYMMQQASERTRILVSEFNLQSQTT